MKKSTLFALCATGAVFACTPVSFAITGDFFMVVDSTGDRVSLFSAADGSVVDLDWLTDAGASGWAFSTPKEATVVGNELWVADQIEDAVHRFDLSNNAYISSITAGPGNVALDNIRSLGTDGSKVYVTNASGGFGNAVITFDTAGNPTGSFPLSGSCFDAEPFGNNIIVSNSTSNALEVYDTGGAFQGNFATGYSFFEQVVVLGDGSVISADAIDTTGIEGVYHFNPDGTIHAFLDTNVSGGPGGTPRGANLLDNGDYLVASSTGVWTATDIGGGNFSWSQVNADINGQYVTRLTLVPTPGALALLGLAGLATRRRRQ